MNNLYMCILNVQTMDSSFCIYDKVIGIFDSLEAAKKEITKINFNDFLRPELSKYTVLQTYTDFHEKNGSWIIEYMEKDDDCTSARIEIKKITKNKLGL